MEDKVELVALPAAIYDAYQKVLPKRREKLLEDLEKKTDEDGEHQSSGEHRSSTKIPTDLFFAERSDLGVEREGQGV